MAGRLRVALGVIVTVCLVGSHVKGDAEWKTSYAPTSTTVSTKSDSYWNTGNEVAVYLIAIPLLLIPLILIGLKFAERGGEHGNGVGHYESNGHYKRAFSAVSNALLTQLTKSVYDAIKE